MEIWQWKKEDNVSSAKNAALKLDSAALLGLMQLQKL